MDSPPAWLRSVNCTLLLKNIIKIKIAAVQALSFETDGRSHQKDEYASATSKKQRRKKRPMDIEQTFFVSTDRV